MQGSGQSTGIAHIKYLQKSGWEFPGRFCVVIPAIYFCSSFVDGLLLFISLPLLLQSSLLAVRRQPLLKIVGPARIEGPAFAVEHIDTRAFCRFFLRISHRCSPSLHTISESMGPVKANCARSWSPGLLRLSLVNV